MPRTLSPAARARHRITADMRHALTLPPDARNAFMAHYPATLDVLAGQCTDPDAAYTVLSTYADDTYERLVEEAEAAQPG